MRFIPIALGALAALALSACGTTKVKNTDVSEKVEAAVITPNGLTGATVTCPKETEAKKNAQIKCTIADDEGNKGAATVTVVDEEGELGAVKGDTDDLERAVVLENANEEAKKKDVSGELDCSETTKPEKGAIYVCTGKVKNSGPAGVVVTQEDDKGDVSVIVSQRRLSTARIKRQIAAQYKKKAKLRVKVSCPAKVKSEIGS
ncbi:MAG: DUF4333 domain-containing protein, partial [Thermoleophilaceae bacterium]|nr:DUF4333 domain-containing protein [Thermoleophilaceae bacterium]